VPTNLRNIDLVKALRLKQVGIALAGVRLIVLIAAVASTIYREFDGPSIRSTMAENAILMSTNSALNEDLDSARDANDDALGKLSVAQVTIERLNIDLQDSRSDHANLQKRLEPYLTIIPLIRISP